MTAVSTTHFIYDGKGGWIEARKVPAPESEDGFRWEFRSATDVVRWLRA